MSYEQRDMEFMISNNFPLSTDEEKDQLAEGYILLDKWVASSQNWRLRGVSLNILFVTGCT